MAVYYQIPFAAAFEHSWPPYSAKGRRRFPRAWQPWTPEEEQLLKELHGKMLSLSNISKILGRGLNGIRLRLQRLHLLPHSAALCRKADMQKPKFSPLPRMENQVILNCSEEQSLGIERTAQEWEADSVHLRLAVQSLDQIHWLVVSLYYGWAGQCVHRFEDIAALLGRSAASVRQICFEAEEILRAGLAYYAKMVK